MTWKHTSLSSRRPLLGGGNEGQASESSVSSENMETCIFLDMKFHNFRFVKHCTGQITEARFYRPVLGELLSCGLALKRWAVKYLQMGKI